MKRANTNERKELIMAIEKVKNLLKEDDKASKRLTLELKLLENKLLDDFFIISKSSAKKQKSQGHKKITTNNSI